MQDLESDRKWVWILDFLLTSITKYCLYAKHDSQLPSGCMLRMTWGKKYEPCVEQSVRLVNTRHCSCSYWRVFMPLGVRLTVNHSRFQVRRSWQDLPWILLVPDTDKQLPSMPRIWELPTSQWSILWTGTFLFVLFGFRCNLFPCSRKRYFFQYLFS